MAKKVDPWAAPIKGLDSSERKKDGTLSKGFQVYEIQILIGFS